ncbi:MAG TPA: hypothetical protein VNT01_17650 [Symbiobacteriaceae bacterium]|nr:hypothetical protein [Symbiobacteriaceae bacterium]
MVSLVLRHDGDGWTCDGNATTANGSCHCIAVDANGEVWFQGAFREMHSRPVQIPGLRKIVGVGASSLHNLAVGSDGIIWGWCLRPFAPEDWEPSSQHLRPRQLLRLPDLPGQAVNVGPIGVCSHQRLAFDCDGEVRTVRYTNLGLSPLVIDRIELIGNCAGDFAICGESFSGVVIYPGSFCEVTLRFAAQAGGRRRAEVIFWSNAINRREPIELEGYGPMESTHEFTLQLPCESAVPVAFAATGQCGPPEITRVLIKGALQEFVVTIPVLVSIEVDAGDCRTVTEELMLATGRLRIESPQDGTAEFTVIQKLQVELPLTLGATADSALEVVGEWSDLQ